MSKDLGLTFSSAFEDAVVGGKKFSDVLKGLEQDIARIIIRKSVTEPLGNAISGIFSGINWGSIFGFGGGKATGGAVSAGTAYLVGEKGPELFVPNTSGGIVPNHALGGGNVQIVQHINVDSRSDMASIHQAMNIAKETAKAEILASMQRGGTYARAIGRA
jgi:phage-related minor tail protein